MLCNVILAVTVALATAAPQPFYSMKKVNLSPEEAQKYLNEPPFTEPKLAGHITRFPLDSVSQFQGQDGLGGYAYGYRTPQATLIENRDRFGSGYGEYAYKTGQNNEVIKVRYDSNGFHQEILKPQEEAEDVRQARLAHERAWQEAAAASRKQPDPQGEYYGNNDYQPEGAASEQQGVYAKPNQGGPRGFIYMYNYPVRRP